MRFLVLGDLHLRIKSPINRIDNIFEAQINKLKQVVDYSKNNEIRIVLLTGDVFDNPSPDRELLNEVVRLFYACKGEIDFIAVYGQHDLYMRSYKSLGRCGLNLLYQAGLVEIADERPIVIDDSVAIYGMSCGEAFPQVLPKYADIFSILLSHEPVLMPKKLEGDRIFSGLLRKLNKEQEEVLKAYVLFINGDWHHPFYYEKNRGVINPGAMTRLSIEEKDIKPGFGVLEIDGMKEFNYKRIEFDCLDGKEIFVESKKEQAEVRDISFKDFLDKLRIGSSGVEGISFIKNVKAWLVKEEDEELKIIIGEALSYVEEKRI